MIQFDEYFSNGLKPPTSMDFLYEYLPKNEYLPKIFEYDFETWWRYEAYLMDSVPGVFCLERSALI